MVLGGFSDGLQCLYRVFLKGVFSSGFQGLSDSFQMFFSTDFANMG